jgi:hypothetical protein
MVNNKLSRLTAEMKAILAVMGDEPVVQREFYRRLGVVPLLQSKLIKLKEYGFIERCGHAVWRKLRDE